MNVMMHSCKGSYNFESENITGNVIRPKSRNDRVLFLLYDVFYVSKYAFQKNRWR